MQGTDRRRWKSTVAGGQGSGRESVAERSPRPTLDHRNTKRQRGRTPAASVLGNTKPKIHQRLQVESRGARGKFMLLPKETSLARVKRSQSFNSSFTQRRASAALLNSSANCFS